MTERVQVTIAVFDESTGWRLDDQSISSIEEHAGEGFQLRVVSSRSQLESVLPETEALVGFPITAEQLSQSAPSVRFVQLTDSIGDAARPLVSALERGVRVASAASMRAPQLAEHAVAMLLALRRSIVDAALAQTQHRWATRELAARCTTLEGATVGVFGPAPIRAAIRTRIEAFGASVHGVGEDGAAGEQCAHLNEMRAVLGSFDSFIIAAPLTPTTRHLIEKRALAELPDHATVVDVSRGGVLDQSALLNALKRRKISAAALDGFEARPLPATSPLWTMPNVLVTPGIAGARKDYWVHGAEIIGQNLRAFGLGQPLRDELIADWYGGTERNELAQQTQ